MRAEQFCLPVDGQIDHSTTRLERASIRPALRTGVCYQNHTNLSMKPIHPNYSIAMPRVAPFALFCDEAGNRLGWILYFDRIRGLPEVGLPYRSICLVRSGRMVGSREVTVG